MIVCDDDDDDGIKLDMATIWIWLNRYSNDPTLTLLPPTRGESEGECLNGEMITSNSTQW